MNPALSNMSDRELLEQIYVILLQVLSKVNEIDDDDKQLSMNVFANIIGDMLIKKRV